MKGNPQVINCLNGLLADELSAINQYIIQSEIFENRGYGALHNSVKTTAIDEMKHAEKLINRILFLEGDIKLDKPGIPKISSSVEEQLGNDCDSEVEAVKSYNLGIKLAEDADDHGTADLLKGILADEERHLNWLETQLGLLKDLKLENYMALQL